MYTHQIVKEDYLGSLSIVLSVGKHNCVGVTMPKLYKSNGLTDELNLCLFEFGICYTV